MRGLVLLSTSSFKSTESNILRLIVELCDEANGCRRLCVTVCSFCGGAGGSSAFGVGALSPNGPNGPKESSKAWSRTGCAPARRGVRIVRPPCVLAWVAGGASVCDAEPEDSYQETLDSNISST